MFPFNFISCEPVDELIPLAREHDVGFIAMKPMAGGMLDNATIAFKYLLQFPDILPIPGIERVHQIEEIAQLLEETVSMTVTEQEEMQRLREELGTVFCRRCDYCQPCTNEIPVSMVMSWPTFVRRFTPQSLFSGVIGDAMEKAADCTECGDCEERCPYHLPIMEMVKDYCGQYKALKREHQKA